MWCFRVFFTWGIQNTDNASWTNLRSRRLTVYFFIALSLGSFKKKGTASQVLSYMVDCKSIAVIVELTFPIDRKKKHWIFCVNYAQNDIH